jgi:hypothetical protein
MRAAMRVYNGRPAEARDPGLRGSRAILAVGGVSVRRLVWGALGLMLAGCQVLGSARDAERWPGEAAESAVVAFLTTRADPAVPSGTLTARTPGLYASEPIVGVAGPRVWQVRQPRADVIALPVGARDRQAGVVWKGDTVVLFEERYCEAPTDTGALYCEPWQPARCCEQVWTLRRGAWTAERPPPRQ